LKINKTVIFLVAAILAVAIGALGINAYVHSRINAAVALERVRQAEAQVVALDAQLKAKDSAISATEAALEASRQAALERERWFAAQLAHVQVATPTELVDQASQILGVSDITTDGKTVTMGLETYRLIVFRIVEHQEYVNVKKPAWDAREALYKSEISDWKAKDIVRDKRDALNAGIIVSLKDAISHQKTATLFEKVAWTGAGFVAGSLFNKLK
jgi:hypothetical protein